MMSGPIESKLSKQQQRNKHCSLKMNSIVFFSHFQHCQLTSLAKESKHAWNLFGVNMAEITVFFNAGNLKFDPPVYERMADTDICMRWWRYSGLSYLQQKLF